MIHSGREMMDAYGRLSRKEQANFDRIFRDFLKFKKNLKELVKQFKPLRILDFQTGERIAGSPLSACFDLHPSQRVKVGDRFEHLGTTWTVTSRQLGIRQSTGGRIYNAQEGGAK